MPSLKAIRKRIGSVKNTRKITRAMKLVAAAKLRRAQDAIIAARPYALALSNVVSELAEVAGTDAHPLFEAREGNRTAIVVFTSDRGLAGAFNANVIKKVEAFVATELPADAEVSLRLIGRKANQYFSRRNARISSFDPAPTGATALDVARETANRIVDDFLSKKVDRVLVVFNEFKSAISQTVMIKQVLPVVPEGGGAGAGAGAAGSAGGVDYAYEPGKEELLARMVPLYVQIGLYRAALENIAGEFGARMSAMENATKNAGEMIAKLTLQYNRARQASITKELLEIIGGAEALKG
ncbi:MAG: ATP synthase F1 subunit gamma [Kofleriaceae bacterium]|nr:ATP synthase F1 subunit gamma [Kofleriaceae bacterium]MCL4226432.1 ATP synthase F1 subunit gamma [Myxococcales bacterium]